MGLGRVALMRKDFPAAEQHFGRVADDFPDSKFAPQAIYYRGVSRYSSTHDHNVLGDTAKTLKSDHDGNEWQLRSIPWLTE